MSKYYRVKQDTFMWDKGAILKKDEDGYRSISDLWNHVDIGEEYISKYIIEDKDNADFFERVYEVSVLGKAKYLAKDAAKAAHEALHKAN